MIVDTSAVIALLVKEPDCLRVATLLEGSAHSAISAVSLLEANLVLGGGSFALPAGTLDEFVVRYRISVVPFTQEHVVHARRAFEKFGKGNHPARLNFGDCAAYATAVLADQALLFVGKDFAQTDVEPALT